ncbi:MAG TPA: hypothetical protein VLA89_09595, partial [Gemmatimonadales bacterium]|nr:hypothetical protein [Gemmatimonadales bacterium]
ADYVEGVQGRYFLPLAPAAAWIFHTRRFQASRLDRLPDQLPDQILPWLSLLSFAAALWTVISRYYLSS